ncbi:MAG: hypothetical protein IMX02_03205 [Limnochordaceae bacterium]|nr:hypothetical protein [Limnochordaceae bacterium]
MSSPYAWIRSTRPTRTLAWPLTLLATSVLLLFAACPALTAQARTSLVVAQEVPVVELDPLAGYINAPSPYEVGLVLFDNLVAFDEQLHVVPSLATGWSVSADGRTWTFHLRKGVKFHDGTEFDAQAVKFNLERYMDPQLNPLNRPLWDPLQAVDVVDRYTVRIVTKFPFPTLLNTLAHGSASMVSPAAVKRYGKEFERHPVGTGPFKLARFDPGSTVVVGALR